MIDVAAHSSDDKWAEWGEGGGRRAKYKKYNRSQSYHAGTQQTTSERKATQRGGGYESVSLLYIYSYIYSCKLICLMIWDTLNWCILCVRM